jgi:spore maturation protein B
MVCAFIKKVKPYDAFITGAKSALPFATALFPFLAGVFILTELFEISGLSTYLTSVCSPFFSLFGIPKELTKLILIKPFSGNGSLVILTEIFNEYGVDSYLARTASAIYGSSETVFYVASVYFANAKRKPPIKAIVISLVASFFSFVFACFICKVI